MGIFIDEPLWPAHGTEWSHLVSDRSMAELHRFAGATGIPARAFDGDHYDVPAAQLAALVDAGAERVGTRSMVRILMSSGLRAKRPRSAKPRYRSRDKAFAAAILTHADGVRAPGYEAVFAADDVENAIKHAQALEPAVDVAVLTSDACGADERLRAVYLESSTIDGRSSYRHPVGAWVLGRVHWNSVLAGGPSAVPDARVPGDVQWEGHDMAGPREVQIRDSAIRLGQLLKLAGFIGDGSEAKMFLADGRVSVNGHTEDRRGRQLHPGDVVDAAGDAVRVVGP
ncbi:DUF4031 domain-containing protein [Spelaeicoccus albus]|uniref:Ribosome-associated protein YbcJ (S4-like RNA binding protein) n=1 Tax=Spelaeicoccus albus TaxID=1280376 RepID=A0A7Z0CZ38_9MICO|nr:DUF4031 domain-containing protein [Spelaeicoccus albus]NYI65936.1 ribosome-associated protein YbcJ (S4-like RNA binding protein) [Spelaeicoccus albus]